MRTKSSLANYVTEQLAFLGRISSRSIFGATGIFIEERLLGIIVDDDTFYLHTGPTNREDYLSRGMPQFKPYPNAFDLTTDHHRVPHDVLKDETQLRDWGERALRAAIEAAKAKQLAGIERSRQAKSKQAKRNRKEGDSG
jgi:TfoX/Sxy family transcriptional regulator of competence genes